MPQSNDTSATEIARGIAVQLAEIEPLAEAAGFAHLVILLRQAREEAERTEPERRN